MAPPAVMSRDEVDETILTEIAQGCNVPVTQIEDIYACIPQQLDFIAERRSEVYQIVLSFSLEADIGRWCEAIRQVVSLNSVLRTRVVRCQLGIVQVVVNEEHVTESQSGDVEQYLRQEMLKAKRQGLGVPLFYSAFIERDFVATMHHAVMDYWSLTTLFNEDVARIYLGHPPMMRPAFKEYVGRCINMDDLAAKSFWASRFKGVPATFPRIDQNISPQLKEDVTRKISLKRIGNRISPGHLASFAEAAWALTVSIYADSESVAYGLVLSGRSPALEGIETTLGPTVADVPVQVNLHRKTSIEQLVKDRATSLRQLTTHPILLQYGIERISKISEAAQIASEFQSLFNVVPPLPMNLQTTEEESRSIQLNRIIWQARGAVSLAPICRILDDEILLQTRYDRAIICERQLHRILNQFEHFLHSLTETPPEVRLEKLQKLNPYDRSEIFQWNNNTAEMIEKRVHDVFSAQAQAHPEAVAVEATDGRATYCQIHQMTDRLAHELRRRGVFPREAVAFDFEKSLWAIVAILGIMKAGGVCVPINKNDPYDHKVAIFSSSKSKMILTSTTHYAMSVDLAPHVLTINVESISKLPEVTGPLDDRMSSPEDLAYISFTSGTTGSSKGVMLKHRCLVSSLTSFARRLNWQSGCRVLQFATHVSNVSIYEIFGALLFGGCLCIPSEEVQEENLSHFIEFNNVNWALLTPSILRTLSPSDMPSLQSLLCIGEFVDAKTAKTWGEALHFFNSWGACEATILNTVTDVTRDACYPNCIGTPVGCAVWIVNPQNPHELAPIGSVGELLVEGPGVAKSYLDDDAKTAAAFVAPPLWTSSCPRRATRFYRTRDLAKYNPEGSISFIGRLENRVKLSGQTVQLEELESVIGSCDEVRDVVTFTKIASGRTQLVAIICLNDPNLPRTKVLQELPDVYAEVADRHLNAIRMYARSRLPSDRVPALWIIAEWLPRTASQKLDRVALRRWLKQLGR